jgi:carbon storage regulator
MLALNRTSGQEIVIGNGITVKVLEVAGNRVRLGIIAPAEVPIRRETVCRATEGCAHDGR